MPAAPVLAAAADPVSATDSRTITYRLQASDSVAGTTFNALHVLVATASSTASMPATVRLQSTNGTMVGAMVTDGSVQRIGLFSADGAPQSAVSYTANYASGHAGVHVLADLVPNTQYVIARNSVSIATVPASSQGVLTFQSPEGGLFTVRHQAAAPIAPANLRIIRRAGNEAEGLPLLRDAGDPTRGRRGKPDRPDRPGRESGGDVVRMIRTIAHLL